VIGTVDAAQRLERVLGNSVDFWLKLEANYQKHKARLEATERHSGNFPGCLSFYSSAVI
jgi:HTH-type transcriptional regulator/antitoxin HigA